MINFTEGKINIGVKNILIGSDCEELNALAEQCLRVEWKTLETVLSNCSTGSTSCRISGGIAVGRVTRCHGSGGFCYVCDLIPYKKCLRTDMPVLLSCQTVALPPEEIVDQAMRRKKR